MKKTSVAQIPFICQWQVVQEDNNHFLSEYLAQFADKLPSDGESEDQITSMVINTIACYIRIHLTCYLYVDLDAIFKGDTSQLTLGGFRRL